MSALAHRYLRVLGGERKADAQLLLPVLQN